MAGLSTGAWLILMVLAFAAGMIVLEVVKLKNITPDDHITAVVRRAIKAQPGPFIWAAFSAGYLCGHLAWW